MVSSLIWLSTRRSHNYSNYSVTIMQYLCVSSVCLLKWRHGILILIWVFTGSSHDHNMIMSLIILPLLSGICVFSGFFFFNWKLDMRTWFWFDFTPGIATTILLLLCGIYVISNLLVFKDPSHRPPVRFEKIIAYEDLKEVYDRRGKMVNKPRSVKL